MLSTFKCVYRFQRSSSRKTDNLTERIELLFISCRWRWCYSPIWSEHCSCFVVLLFCFASTTKISRLYISIQLCMYHNPFALSTPSQTRVCVLIKGTDSRKDIHNKTQHITNKNKADILMWTYIVDGRLDRLRLVISTWICRTRSCYYICMYFLSHFAPTVK